MRSQSIENLSGICEVCLEGVDINWWIRKRYEIQVEDFVAFAEEVGDNMTTGFTRSACEYLQMIIQ